VPTGFFHYFENIGKEDLHFLVVFNNSAAESGDDIGISVSRGGIPDHVLAACFGGHARAFHKIPKLHKEVVIALRR
jgi:oxalate decarboxylase